MTHREPVPHYTVVGIDEYLENTDNRVSVEDMIDSDEVYVFYGRIQKISQFAMRAHVSASITEHHAHGIQYSGSITFRDMDFSPASPSYEYSGLFHARFFVPDSINPILVKTGRVSKRPLDMGFLVREDEGYEDELLRELAHPSLDQNSELLDSVGV